MQINQAIDSPSVSGDKQDLYSLRNDIEELIGLTKETLTTLKKPTVEDSTGSENQKDEFSDEYALFKVSSWNFNCNFVNNRLSLIYG